MKIARLRICTSGCVVVALIMVGGGCGSRPDPCDAYPDSFSGRMTGTFDGSPFDASVQVVLETAPGQYGGTFHATGLDGVFYFRVDCTDGRTSTVSGLTGWNEVPTVEPYGRGPLSGNVRPSGGTGTWTCRYGCSGGGSWTLQ